MSAVVWIAAGALGGLGALGRALVDLGLRRSLGPGFPYGILVANLTGAFAEGVVIGAIDSTTARFLVGGALLGGYTTFSTWMLDTLAMWRDGRRRLAAINLLGSLVAGAAVAALGWSVAHAIA